MTYKIKLDMQKLVDMFYIAGLNAWFEFDGKKYTVFEVRHMKPSLVYVKQLLLDCQGQVYIINYFDGKTVGMRKFNT